MNSDTKIDTKQSALDIGHNLMLSTPDCRIFVPRLQEFVFEIQTTGHVIGTTLAS